MERPYASTSVEELVEKIENVFSALMRDYGHVDEGYCFSCDEEPWQVLDEIKQRFSERPNWPADVHKQYLAVLDERDTIQAQYDSLQDEYNELRWRMDSLER